MAVRRKILDDLFDAFTIIAGANYVSLYDVKGQMTRYSRAAVDLFGLPGEYIPDGSDDWADYVHPEDRKRYTSVMGELLAGDAHTYNLTYRVRMKDGNYGMFRFIGAILRTEDTNEPELVGGITLNEGLLENTDSVTVLRNQYGFLRDLETVIDTHQKNVILLLGVSRMSDINEKYGYGYGNHVLQQVGWIIQENAGQYGTVYRMEGAKFAVMTDQLSPGKMAEIYENMRQRLLGGIDVDGTKQTLVLNGGLLMTVDSKMNEQSVFTCLRHAFRESKIRRHGKLVDFNGNLRESDQGVLRMIDTIRNCILKDAEGFVMHYQPTFQVGSDRPIGVEALLRFHHDTYGDVAPSEYIPVLERDFIFEELGYWILYRSMRDGMGFLEKNPDFILGVNIASVQIEDDYFVDEIRDIAEETGFPLNNLCIELTKDCRQLDGELLKNTVGALRELGVQIIIDDFGTGVASIDFLRDLQPDFIKFDMKYVRDIAHSEEDQKIIRHMSELAAGCGTKVCVKGIETQEICDIIRECQVSVMQGFLFGKALPAEELLEKI